MFVVFNAQKQNQSHLPPGLTHGTTCFDVYKLTTQHVSRSKLFSVRTLSFNIVNLVGFEWGWSMKAMWSLFQFSPIAYVMGGRVGIDDTHCVHLET